MVKRTFWVCLVFVSCFLNILKMLVFPFYEWEWRSPELKKINKLMRQHLKGQKRTEVFLGGESDFDWEPPLLTQELTHSSQDEIVPNPKAYFVPRAAMQQGGNKQGKVTVVPCFPVSGKSRSERVTPYDRPEAYRSITS
jgi:hypothetical protein